jgi:hypothetical protein
VDEAGVRALLDRVSATPAPPSAVDIGLARRRGLSRLRRRRWGTALAPVLAAAAVAAIILGTGALAGRTGSGTHGSPRPVSPVVSPPHRFNPLIPYVTFGWLPPGVPRGADIAQSLPTDQIAVAGTLQTGQYQLTVWAPGTCDRDPAQLAEALQRNRQPQLDCAQSPSAGSVASVLRQAPPVHGRPAFWMRGHFLAWEYARHSWVTLVAYRRGTAVPAAIVLRVAGSVHYGAPGPAPRFPYQFTGIPASWQVTWANWKAGDLLGRNLSAGQVGQVVVTPGRGKCWFTPGESQRLTLNGARAVLTVFRQPGVRTYQSLCVPEVDGLSVYFQLYRAHGEHGFPFGGAAGLYLHHLHLLGPDPANWTTRPLG